jgi:hypothetical protein
MNNNVTAISTLKSSLYITVIPCYTSFTLLKVQVLVVQVQLRDVQIVEVKVPVEVQLTVTSITRRICKV